MLRLFLIVSLLLGGGLLSASRTTGKSANTPSTYTVRSGDSLYTIAQFLHTSVKALREANGLKEGTLLHPGQKLKIPAPATAKAKTKTVKPPLADSGKSARAMKKKSGKPKLRLYAVQPGDTPSTIAQQHGISTKELLQANEMKPNSLIRVGQALVIPSPGSQGMFPSKKTAKKTSKTAGKKTKNARKQTSKKTAGKKVKPGIHVVSYGDTLFSIARRYKTPLKDLMSLNGIAPTDVIHPGQELKIPGSSYRAKAASSKKKPKKTAAKKAKPVKPVIYTVRHGDTLWKIAKKHKVTIGEIRRLNKMKRKDVIRSGMKLVIKEGSQPASTSALAKAKKKKEPKKIAKLYTVKKGDTLWEIAKRHKTSVAELRRLNKMQRKDVIHTGMKLTVGYEKVPPTRIAKTQKKEKAASKKKVAQKKATKKQRVASAGKKKKESRSRKKKSADKRISSALAALNGKGSGGRRGSRGGDYNVIRTAKRYLGRRYVWGAEGPSSFDCSGFTQYVMRKSKGVKLPRVSRKQAYYGKYVTRSQLRPGDLIFFDTSRRRRGYVNHVGIYIGNGKFIHASSARHRVVITSLNSPFYRARFKWGRRIN
jgi:LysM repeat protein